jgi:phosphatidyl-myo-inositol dimannoside synthase
MSKQLLLTYDFPPIGGGIARWMGELAKHYPPGSLVVSTGFHPDAASIDAQFPNRIDRLPTRARRLRTLPNLVRWSRRVMVLSRAMDLEFTWCGNLKPAGYPAKWLALRRGVPYGLVVHGGDLLILQQQVGRSVHKRQTTRSLLRSASVIVANSRWTADLCRSLLDTLGLNVAGNAVRVVPLGSDPESFRPGTDTAEVRRRYGLDGRRWLMTVARLTPHKGIDTGLRALAELRNSYPTLGYVVIGFGQELVALQSLARQLSVSDRVLFLTDVPDSDLPGLYNCAEIYLGLSRQMVRNVEGFGISLVEAGACGVPVIAGRSGGIPDAVRDGETGLLVDSEHLEEVSTAIRRLLDNESLARSLGAGGRRAVESYYNWRRVATDLYDIGQELGKAAGHPVAGK